MVNNKTSKADGIALSASSFLYTFFRKVFPITFLFLFAFSGLHAQKASKDYAMSIQEKGSLYFIYPQKGFKNTTNSNPFVFDITYLNSSDSLTLNFTYTDKGFFKLDSLALYSNNAALTASPVSRIFVESSKSDWIYRYSARLLFEDTYRFFAENPKSPEIHLFYEGQTIRLKMKDGDWKKIMEKDLRIFNMIKANQKDKQPANTNKN